MRKIEDGPLKEYWEERDRQFQEDKKNYKGPHCCLIMHYSVDALNPENVSPCSYNPKFRGYYLTAKRGWGGHKIDFCPFCGIKLPEELSDMWFDILEKEFGLDNPIGLEQQQKVPADFLTDQWWKKRGL